MLEPPVKWRSVARWEEGAREVPADAATLLQEIDRTVETLVARALAQIDSLAQTHGDANRIVFLRYASDDDLGRIDPTTLQQLRSHRVHAAMLGRLRRAAAARDLECRIVTFNPTAYAAWLKKTNLSDDPAARSAWAAQALDRHR